MESCFVDKIITKRQKKKKINSKNNFALQIQGYNPALKPRLTVLKLTRGQDFQLLLKCDFLLKYTWL